MQLKFSKKLNLKKNQKSFFKFGTTLEINLILKLKAKIVQKQCSFFISIFNLLLWNNLINRVLVQVIKFTNSYL